MAGIKTELNDSIQIIDYFLVDRWARLRTGGGFSNNDDFCSYLLDQEEFRQSGMIFSRYQIEPEPTPEEKLPKIAAERAADNPFVVPVGKSEPIVRKVSLVSVLKPKSTPASATKEGIVQKGVKARARTPFMKRGKLSKTEVKVCQPPVRKIVRVTHTTSLLPVVKVLSHAVKKESKSMSNCSNPSVLRLKKTTSLLKKPEICATKICFESNMQQGKKVTKVVLKRASLLGNPVQPAKKTKLENSEANSRQDVVSIACKQCDQVFFSAKKLEEHLGRVHPRKSYACTKCPKVYNRRSSLQAHKKNLKHYDSDECPYLAGTKSAYFCHRCNRGYRKTTAFRNHIERIHNMQQSFGYRGRPSVSLDKSPSHIPHERKVLEKPLVRLKTREGKEEGVDSGSFCHVCGKLYSNPTRLKCHLDLHEGNRRKFLCDKCDETFNFRKSLELHVNKVHLNVKDHKCLMCIKAYYTEEDLKHHTHCIHFDETEPQYRCSLTECNARFMTAAERDDHVTLGEHNVKPLKSFAHRKVPCPKCAKLVVRRVLKKHMASHTGERRKACPHCPVTLVTAAGLRKHLVSVHKEGVERLTQCELCPAKFRNPHAIKYHMYTRHRDRPVEAEPTLARERDTDVSGRVTN